MSHTATTETCPRCGAPFRCDVDSYPKDPCWCRAIELTPALLTELDARFEGCLCPDCLDELANKDSSPKF